MWHTHTHARHKCTRLQAFAVHDVHRSGHGDRMPLKLKLQQCVCVCVWGKWCYSLNSSWLWHLLWTALMKLKFSSGCCNLTVKQHRKHCSYSNRKDKHKACGIDNEQLPLLSETEAVVTQYLSMQVSWYLDQITEPCDSLITRFQHKRASWSRISDSENQRSLANPNGKIQDGCCAHQQLKSCRNILSYLCLIESAVHTVLCVM